MDITKIRFNSLAEVEKADFDAGDWASMANAVTACNNALSDATALERCECFQAGLVFLTSESITPEDATKLLFDDRSGVRCLVLAALAAGKTIDDGVRLIWRELPRFNGKELHFALQALERWDGDAGLASRVLSKARKSWLAEPARAVIRAFLARRLDLGDEPNWDQSLARATPGGLYAIEKIVRGFVHPKARRLYRDFRRRQALRNARIVLEGLGRFLLATQEGGPGSLYDTCALQAAVSDLEHSLVSENRHCSCLLVGPEGVGKTTAVQIFARRIAAHGWSVIEVSTTRLIAGQPHIGDVEAATERLIAALTACERVIWYVPDFAHLQWAGRHSQSPVSVLDLILPAVKRGDIRVLGEVSADELDVLQRQQPGATAGFRRVQIKTISPAETHALVEAVAKAIDPSGRGVPPKQVEDLVTLTTRFGAGQTQPGAAVTLLRQTISSIAGDADDDDTDIISKASEIMGIPAELVSGSRHFDATHLRRRLSERVIGQEDAVEAVVSRIAYMKAGLAERDRPLGVFLFAGPTGTGKTELARQIARYLLGSESALIRLDMSEYQSRGSGERLLGDSFGWGDGEDSLASKVRQHPFAVILLDEIEKADPSVWDVFLQVFDAGRLTDRRGRTVNFDASMIFMTTNLGAVSAFQPSIGYHEATRRFTPDRIRAAIGAEFRPELVNRIDKVLVFRPLGSKQLSAILDRDMRELESRPGLADGRWHLHVEPSAKNLLLKVGDSNQHGARHLRRAIEQYLLEPLALRLAEIAETNASGRIVVTAESARLAFELILDDGQGVAQPHAA